MNFGVSAIAEALGKTRQAVLKDIKSKNVSISWDESTGRKRVVIEASEIERAWHINMMVAPSKRQPLLQKVVDENRYLDDLLKQKDAMIAFLTEQVAVKDEQIAVANRLLAAPKAGPEMVITPLLSSHQAAQEALTSVVVVAEDGAAPTHAPEVKKTGFWPWSKKAG